MGLIRFMLNFAIVLAFWTFVGQVPYKGVSLENRYHAWVNSISMQQVFETTFAPFKWSRDRVASLIEDFKENDLTKAR